MVVLRFKGNISGSLALLGIHKVAFLYAVLIKLEGELTVLQRISFHILLRLQHCLSRCIDVRELGCFRFFLFTLSCLCIRCPIFLVRDAAYCQLSFFGFYNHRCCPYASIVGVACYISGFLYDLVRIRSGCVVVLRFKGNISGSLALLGIHKVAFLYAVLIKLEGELTVLQRISFHILLRLQHCLSSNIGVREACRKQRFWLLNILFLSNLSAAYHYILRSVFFSCYDYSHFIDCFIVGDSSNFSFDFPYFVLIRSFFVILDFSKTYLVSVSNGYFCLGRQRRFFCLGSQYELERIFS